MSSVRSKSKLIEVLRRIGVLSKEQVEIAAKEIDAHPEVPTADLIVGLGLASESDIKRAEEIQREMGSTDLLRERLKAASSEASNLGDSSTELAAIAERVKKG